MSGSRVDPIARINQQISELASRLSRQPYDEKLIAQIAALSKERDEIAKRWAKEFSEALYELNWGGQS